MRRQHCSSLCSQSEGHGHVAKITTKYILPQTAQQRITRINEFRGRRMGRQHCSSLCSQSEGHGHVAKMLKFAIGSLFYGVSAIKSSPSLCEQSELQCFASDFRRMFAHRPLHVQPPAKPSIPEPRTFFSVFHPTKKRCSELVSLQEYCKLILNTYLFAEERFRSFLFLKDPLHFS